MPTKRQINKMSPEQVDAALNLSVERDLSIMVGRLHDRVDTLRKFKHKLNPDHIQNRYDMIKSEFDDLISNMHERGYGDIIDRVVKNLGQLPKL